MTDLLDRVYQCIKAHPGANIDSTANELRAPKLQVEACFDRLRRDRRICQPLPGHWYAGHTAAPMRDLPVHAPARPVISKSKADQPRSHKKKWTPPPGPRECGGCKTVKPPEHFSKGCTKCKPCVAKYYKAYRHSIHGKPMRESDLQRRFVKNQRAACL